MDFSITKQKLDSFQSVFLWIKKEVHIFIIIFSLKSEND